jgi:hypothetical protein
MEKAKLIKKIMKNGSILKVTSNSMLPILKDGQKIRINTTLNPKFGDIIIFLRENILIIHRYYFKINGKCFTKGDNLRSFDLPWAFNNYIGRADVPVAILDKIWMLIVIIKLASRFFLKKVYYQNRKFYNFKQRILEEVLLSCEFALCLREKLDNAVKTLSPLPNYQFRYIHRFAIRYIG